MDVFSSQLATELARSFDAIVRSQISGVLGHDNWTPGEMAPRCEIRCYPDGREVFSFDDRALVEFYPIKVETEYKNSSARLIATRPYRMLG